MEKSILRKHNLVYRTTNKVNGKEYIGVHSTDRLEDGYIGSGVNRQSKIKHILKRRPTVFLRALNKYGYENFEREVLFDFPTVQEALLKEKELVNEEYLQRPNTYNVSLGGRSGYMTEEIKKFFEECRAREYVVVNVKTFDVYFVKNLNKWSRKMGLDSPRGDSQLRCVLSGDCSLIKHCWWACRLEDWKGYPEVREFKYPKFKEPNLKARVYQPIGLYNEEGVLLNFGSSKEAAKIIQVAPARLLDLIDGKHHHVKGYTSSYENYEKRITRFLSPEGVEYKTQNIKKFCRDNNLDSKSMFDIKSGKHSTYKGWQHIK